MLICGVRGILFYETGKEKRKWVEICHHSYQFACICLTLFFVFFILHEIKESTFLKGLSHEIRELLFYRPPWPFPARPCPWEESHGTTGPNPGVVDRSGWSERFSLASKYRTRLMFATTPAQPCASIVRSFYAACSDRDCSVKVCLHRSFIQL